MVDELLATLKPDILRTMMLSREKHCPTLLIDGLNLTRQRTSPWTNKGAESNVLNYIAKSVDRFATSLKADWRHWVNLQYMQQYTSDFQVWFTRFYIAFWDLMRMPRFQQQVASKNTGHRFWGFSQYNDRVPVIGDHLTALFRSTIPAQVLQELQKNVYSLPYLVSDWVHPVTDCPYVQY